MIKVTNLKRSFGPVKAVNDISFEVQKGEILGFLGPNGAGKTTTMRLLTGFLKPDSGEIMINDLKLDENSITVRSKLGYLPENNPLYHDFNTVEYLECIARLRQVPKDQVKSAVRKVIRSCGLAEVIRKDIGKLSKGFQQRVGLAQTLIHGPEILILDEPTTGLDPNQKTEIRDLIRAIGRTTTIIFCSHVLSEVEALCSRVLIINHGKIVGSGTPAELEAQTSSKNVIKVKIKGRDKNIISQLKALPGVLQVEVIASPAEDSTVIRLTIEPNKDLRQTVVKQIVSAGLDLLEMAKETVSLEEVFAKLTTKKI